MIMTKQEKEQALAEIRENLNEISILLEECKKTLEGFNLSPLNK